MGRTDNQPVPKETDEAVAGAAEGGPLGENVNWGVDWWMGSGWGSLQQSLVWAEAGVSERAWAPARCPRQDQPGGQSGPEQWASFCCVFVMLLIKESQR